MELKSLTIPTSLELEGLVKVYKEVINDTFNIYTKKKVIDDTTKVVIKPKVNVRRGLLSKEELYSS